MSRLNRILLVEDEPDIQAVVRLSLEMVGQFQVEVCGSGEAALKRVKGFSPELILLDVMMPGLDGPATLAALRADPSTASIPVIFMTAKVQPQEVQHYKSLGALEVIAKPFDPMQLPERLHTIWGQNS